jgi:Acyl-CoA reductase (LuxC)
MGARGAHIIAGNIPIVATLTTMRTAVARNDAIVKLPSNDPLTAIAIARTMIEMAPDHPVTRHFSVGYWKGAIPTSRPKSITLQASRNGWHGADSPPSSTSPAISKRESISLRSIRRTAPPSLAARR